MKNVLLLVVLASFLVSCNVNPNKEERIQKLESELTMVTDKVLEIEKKVQLLKDENELLKSRINILEQP